VQRGPDPRELSPATYITGFGALWDEQRHEAVTDYIDPPSPAFAAGLHPGSADKNEVDVISLKMVGDSMKKDGGSPN
jgi:hypothetical protein